MKSTDFKLFGGRIFYGWWIVVVCIIVIFAADTVYNTVLTVFVKPVSQDFGWTRATFSGAITVGVLSGGVISLLIGPLIDRHGAKPVFIGGSAVTGGCLLLLSQLSAVWQFYLLIGLARGAAIAVVQLASGVAVSNWFIKKRGRAIGVMVTGGRLGASLLPLFAQYLIATRGWRATWFILGLFIWLSSIVPSMLFIKRRPEDVGLIPDGEAQEAARERDESTDSLHRNNGEPPESEPAWTLRQALKTPAFWLLTIASAQGMMAIGGVNLHQFPYLTDRGILPSIAVAAISVFAFWSGIGSLLWGFIAERVSIRYSLMASLMASAAGLVLLLSVRNTAMAFGYAVFYGFSMGGIMALTQIVYADYFGRKSLGAIRGFTAPFQMVANAFGPLFAGLMFDIRGSYSLAFSLLAAVYFLGGIWMILAHPPRYSRSVISSKTIKKS